MTDQHKPSIALTITTAVLLSANISLGADWPQWRGPARNGIAEPGPKIASEWPSDGPTKVWEYPAPKSRGGGLGSVVVSGGRAFALWSHQVATPIPTRQFTVRELRQIGWIDRDLPEELAAKVEQTRLSEELKGIKRNAKTEWIQKWVEENLTGEDSRRLSWVVRSRLAMGEAALSFEELRKLDPLKERTFDTQQQLDEWIAEAGLSVEAAKAVNKAAIKEHKTADGVVVCLDAETGEEVWKKVVTGKPSSYGISNTPCVADGRVYVVGSTGEAHCLAAKDGQQLWKRQLPTGTHASFMVADGLAIVPSTTLTALSAEAGEVVWQTKEVATNSNSPVLWRHAGQAYVICNTRKSVFCVGLKEGKVLWKVPGGEYSTAVVEGDLMVIMGGEKVGLLAYRISPESAEKVWASEINDRGASPIVHKGHVYAVGKGKAACLRLEDGEVLWEQKLRFGGICSPVLVGDKILVPTRGSLFMLAASPEEQGTLASARIRIAHCTSPAAANGKLYLRLDEALACFDLTAQ